MATATNGIKYDLSTMPHAPKMRVAIIVAQWNANITEALAQGARDTLKELGLNSENIITYHVPGAVELTYAAARVMQQHDDIDAIMVFGCVIKGDTPHFDYVCSSVNHGVAELNLRAKTPVIFGVLTVNSEQQALDRAGGVLGNKGSEAAIAAVQMHLLKEEIG